ncbi:hypothetical protein COV06_00665 [Candidatus Uhrbacteria bacterium CG10_big_fil_rev_8_21_14_0_10_50_16]|uniref:Uncharacterized protein n=1 Tax=Candidatus Uhrbacteria bacterium CG10_big_fil_rev_8_21_14_0_10_50_16 TaxID=1975039 RepID=A0A2H0RMW8_9BACT|nr:MAG: hypothetical protein COV06_00665 [Candidatus Uhrbacteria bacterium CG10_big_fil_rev_8_21_14_0_10_50_16]
MAYNIPSGPIGQMNSGGGPMRTKKQPNILQAIAGAFIGVLLVLGSPVAMWMAGSQHRAKDFQVAQQVDLDTVASGYVTFRGAPELVTKTAKTCFDSDCIYEHESVERLETKQSLECSKDIKQDEMTRILYQDGSEYNDETGETVPCYQVERDSWVVKTEHVIANDVMVGSFTITPNERAEYLETVETIDETEFDLNDKAIARSVYTTFRTPDMLLVAGESSDGRVVMPEKRTYVFSQYDHPLTLQKLRDIDKESRMILWLVTFAMIFIGYSMIFGPIQSLARIALHIPGLAPVGRAIAQGSRAMIGVLSFILAVVTWAIVWFFVTIIQVWWLGLIVVVLLGLLGWWLSKRKK